MLHIRKKHAIKTDINKGADNDEEQIKSGPWDAASLARLMTPARRGFVAGFRLTLEISHVLLVTSSIKSWALD